MSEKISGVEGTKAGFSYLQLSSKMRTGRPPVIARLIIICLKFEGFFIKLQTLFCIVFVLFFFLFLGKKLSEEMLFIISKIIHDDDFYNMTPEADLDFHLLF